MKLFVFDNGEGCGLDLAIRARDADHDVRYWVPAISSVSNKPAGPYGLGLVEKVSEWEPEMKWADLIVMTGNSSYESALAPYFGKGYPIFGTNSKAARLELDREHGQEILKRHGVAVPPYHVVDNLDDAIRLVAKTGLSYAIKPWGGESDKSMTCVARDANEAIFMLTLWKEKGLKGQLMLQEKIDGVEIGISGFFGPHGWNRALEESFEYKKFMVDDLGCNTGEMGTVIRHVKKSKLFDLVLDPITDYLHECNYIGDCSVNCIVDKRGTPWPLEFTMRLGWPDFCIRQEVIRSDPAEWMADLVHGVDSLEVSNETVVGVLLSHGDFPTCRDADEDWSGYPINGITSDNYPHLHFQEMMKGKAPFLVGGKVKEMSIEMTAGNYVMVVTGAGGSIADARKKAYDVAWQISLPSNLMFRTDIGDGLEKDLPKLQKHGFAEGMK